MASVIFLRGMNVGRRRITNDDLSGAFTRLGYASPTPYQASGNIILPEVDTVDVEALEVGLEAELGYAVPVFARSGSQVKQLAVACPYADRRGPDDGKPQIVLLHQAVTADLSAIFGSEDEHDVIGTEIHWLPAGGLADSGPLLKELDQAVGGTTVRTLGTIQRLAKKLG